jgi:tungstate transport system permease protein
LVAIFCATALNSSQLDLWKQARKQLIGRFSFDTALAFYRQAAQRFDFFSCALWPNLRPRFRGFSFAEVSLMLDLSEAFRAALRQISVLDPHLIEIVGLSLRVTLTAVFLATVIGFAVGGALAVYRFPGRGTLAAVLNALMGLPPVVAGLFVYILLSNAGPLGVLQLLYTPVAMIIAQIILIVPIISALTRQTCEDLLEEYREQLRSLGASSAATVTTLLWDGRYRLVTAVLAGFGRAIAEVGAVMIVGGNIDHVTRTMTTAIALETSKGNIALALALGMILLTIALAINMALMGIRRIASRFAYA